MAARSRGKARTTAKDRARERGVPGDGRGRTDEVGHSGVYPASGPLPRGEAPLRTQAAWGQGERGPAGAEDSGRSEVIPPGMEGRPDETRPLRADWLPAHPPTNLDSSAGTAR
jgi:hypothetical protein